MKSREQAIRDLNDVGYSDLSLGVNAGVIYHWIDAKDLLSFFLIG